MLIKEHVGKKVLKSDSVAKILHSIINALDNIDRDKEHFYVICLDRGCRIKFIDLVSVGIISSTLVHPREVFRRAIIEGAETIIVGHNHPSGSLKPSKEDIDVTKKLQEGGNIIGIKILDHIIVSDTAYVSLTDEGVL